MPFNGQIVPQWNHPHNSTYINDNTTSAPQATSNSIGCKVLNVFVSGRGKDNVILEKESDVAYLNEYGTPNMQLYGQAGYMPWAALKSGHASAYCMRIMPDDAAYANSILVARVKYNDKPTEVVVLNPNYSPDPAINPKEIKNPLYQPMYIENPYKDLTVNELIDTIGFEKLMPNIKFNPSIPVNEETNPLVVANRYRIFDGSTFDDTRDPGVILDASDFNNGTNPDFIADGLEFNGGVNVFKGIEFVTNAGYDASISEYIPNPDYEPETIVDVIPADNKIHISYELMSANFSDVSLIDSIMSKLYSDNSTEDNEGYIKVPICMFYASGRGDYGNIFRFRITSDAQSDKLNPYKNYLVETFTSDNSITRELYTRTSIYEDAIEKNTSLFMNDVINDPDKGSQTVQCYVWAEGVEKIVDMYNQNITSNQVDIATFDLFFGRQKGGLKIPELVIESIKPTDISVDNVAGNAFVNGSDGAFSLSRPAAERMAAINKAYIAAFSGKIDRGLVSKKRTPVNFIFDAGYDKEVKDALKGLILTRSDAQGFMDAGILNTSTELLNWLEENKDGDRLYSKESQHYAIKDPFTGKKILVTATYFLANNLPRHVVVNGIHRPFTGETFAKLTGHIKNSLKPVVDGDDATLKEQLFEAKVNYFEAVGENVYTRSTQTTSQAVKSDLSEENNMRVLLSMKRDIEKMVSGLAYNFSEPEDRRIFTESASRLLSHYKTMCRNAEVKFDVTPYEEEHSILHCYLEVTFKNLVKTGIVEIDINPRV